MIQECAQFDPDGIRIGIFEDDRLELCRFFSYAEKSWKEEPLGYWRDLNVAQELLPLQVLYNKQFFKEPESGSIIPERGVE